SRLLGRWGRALCFVAFLRRFRVCQPEVSWGLKMPVMVNRETTVESAREGLVEMPSEAVRQMRIPRDAGPAPLPPKFAPDPDCCFRAKDAPAPETAPARRTRPDRPEILSPRGSTNVPCGSAPAASPPTDTAPPSACPDRDSIPAPGNPRRADALSLAPACIPNP